MESKSKKQFQHGVRIGFSLEQYDGIVCSHKKLRKLFIYL